MQSVDEPLQIFASPELAKLDELETDTEVSDLDLWCVVCRSLHFVGE